MKIEPTLLEKYNVNGPRYTSYPTALQFNDQFGPREYLWHIERSNQDPVPKPLSLYIHIPFCKSLCYYCGCHKFITQSQHKVVAYLDALHREIEMQSVLFDPDREVKQLHFGGGTPTYLSVDELAQLYNHLKQHFTLVAAPYCDTSIEIDPRTMTLEGISALAEIGFNRMSFGIQDFDRQVQLAINRIQDKAHTLSLLHAARAAGVASISVDLIYGLPKQTLAGFSDTLTAIIEAKPDRVALYNYAHRPQSIKSQRLIPTSSIPGINEKLRLLNLAIQKLTDAGYCYIGMDHFALPTDTLSQSLDTGFLHRNFQGYSTHGDCDIAGFGVSAISHINDSFSQNSKSLQDYQACIQHQQLAVKRGYALSADDKIRAAVIQHIMCHRVIDFKALGDLYRIVFKQYFHRELIALREMVDDGVVILNEGNLYITDNGSLLRRNIAMIFDAYLPLNSPEDNLTNFSKVL